MKRKILIGTAISLGFAYLALRDVSWSTFAATLRGAAPWPLVLAVVVTMAGVFLRAWRWQIIVDPIKRVGVGRLFTVFTIGSMANNVLPVRLGELVRAFLLGRSERLSKSAALATIVYERIVDVFAALALLWIALLIAPGPPWLRSGGLWVLGLNTLGLVVLVLMVVFRHQVADLGGRLARPLGERAVGRLRALLSSFVSGLASVTSLRASAGILLHSAAITLASILAVHLCFGGLSLELPLSAAVTLTVLVSFATMIPAAPGNVGPVQYACIVGLELYGVAKGEALAYSLVYHATQYLPVTLLGLVLLWREQLGLRELAHESRTTDPRDAPTPGDEPGPEA